LRFEACIPKTDASQPHHETRGEEIMKGARRTMRTTTAKRKGWIILVMRPPMPIDNTLLSLSLHPKHEQHAAVQEDERK
jgi:hypothetical protein